MTKTYTLNAISKAFLVLTLANGLALLSVSAAKNTPARQNAVQEVQSADTTTRVVPPSTTQATVLISTSNTTVVNPSTLPAYLNKNIDNGKLVVGGIELVNNICPWKIGQVPDASTGAYKPLQAGTKLTALNADNYFRDVNGTTNFCGHVSIAKDLTVTGTLISNSGQFCLTSDVAINPANMLLVNTINPVKSVGGVCVVDDSDCAVTNFSGDINVKGRRLGSMSNITLDACPLRVLKLHFSGGAYDHTLCAPAAVKIHFVGYGTDVYDDCFSVCFTQEVVVSPDSNTFCNISDPVNCISSTPDVDDVALSMERFSDEYDLNTDVYLDLNLPDGDLTYHGCVFYEIIGCDNLTSIECVANLV